MLVKPLVRPIVRAIAGNPTASLGSGFSPTSLFLDGSKGVVYDNNDLSSFYLDSAGTTAATVNGLVGLQLDKSQGLTLGAENVAGTYSGTANGVWAIGASSITRNGEAALTCILSSISTYSGWVRVSFDVANLSGDTFTISANGGANVGNITSNGSKSYLINAASGAVLTFIPWGGTAGQVTITNISIKSLSGNHRYQSTTGSKPVLRGTPIGANLVTNGDFATDTVWTKQAGWTISGGTANVNSTSGTTLISQGSAVSGKVYRVTFTISSYTSGSIRAQIGAANGVSRTAAGTYVEYITSVDTGAFAITGLSTNAVGSVDNVEFVDVSAGSVTAPYGLQYDGVDDFMQTAAVDFTATDKMFVCAGVRKLSDAALAIFAELSASASANAGAFYISVPNNASGAYGFKSRGSLDNSGGTSVARLGPLTHAITTQFDIAGDAQSIRVNGAADGSAAVDQGTGNFGNYAIYFGRRGGTSLPYSGLDFGLVICGKTLTSTQISSTERYIAQRTGISI